MAFFSTLEIRAGIGNGTTRGEELTALLGGGRTAVLSYVLTDERSLLFLITSSPPNRAPAIKVISLPLTREELAPLIEQFRRQVTGRDPGYRLLARELYDGLIGPATSELRGAGALCLIPDGILWEVPFQALISPGGRHLLEEYALHYAPSLSILGEIARRGPSRHDSSSLLALGNPSPGGELIAQLRESRRGENFAPLPEAELEVKIVAQLHGASGSRTLLREEASEKAFKTLARGRQTLHFATHGVLDNRQPLYSYLLLANPEDRSEEDGLLEAREIMRLRLDADLVVLSACETARGKISAGEGVIGMIWAFLMAGCRTVVVSQWKVDSVRTAELMVGFFQFLRGDRQGQPGYKAEALRQAARRMISDPRTRHPFYWAGFIVAGSDR